MAQLATESLWHFAGYLHLQDLLNLAPIRYEGAPTYTTEDYQPEFIAPLSEFEVEWSSVGRSMPAPSNGPSADQHLTTPTTHISAASMAGFRTVINIDPATINLFGASSSLGPLSSSTVITSQSTIPLDAGLTVTARYEIGASQYLDILVQQLNTMFDLDIVFGNRDVIEQAETVLDPHTLETLSVLIATAEDFIPQAVRDALTHPGNINRTVTSPDDEYFTNLDNAGDQAPLINVDGSGQFVNVEKIAGPEQTIAEQLADINAAIERVQTSPDNDGDAEPTDVAEVLNEITAGGTNQIAKLGDNASVNAATIFDYEEALSSRIILGDYHETNAIVQINVLHDIDDIDVSGAALVAQIAAKDNKLSNEATIVNDPGQLFGDATRGVPGATNWEITYVVGNFYDVSTVIQKNVLFDDDANSTDATHGQYTAELGEDGQLNITQLLELGSGYDLIIIAGDYYKFNAIIQTNIILDDDLIKQYAEGGSALQSVDSDGNLLANDATIYNIGGATFKDVSDDAQFLADTIGAQTDEFDYALAVGLPGDGDDVFEVLYVTGDYYNYNVILQTNVITDADQSEQTIAALDDTGQPVSQTAEAGGNTAQNAAIIVDLDSQSDYQFLGGEAYEDTLLVQANIIEDGEEQDEGSSDLDPDVVATIAALSGQDDAENDQNSNTYSPAETNTSDSDVMGGVLA